MISDARALALCSFEGPPERSLTVSGGYGEGETPLPIPNRAVKPLSADGTWPARAWESRSPPVFIQFSTPPRLLTGTWRGRFASCSGRIAHDVADLRFRPSHAIVLGEAILIGDPSSSAF